MALSLNVQIAYKARQNPPLVPLAVMHGFNDSISSFMASDRERWADYGYFVITPQMRGRGTSTGTPDASGREIQDIVDAVNYFRTQYPLLIDADKAVIMGYSGGGGNAYAAAAKFPDFFTSAISFFGISDYGYDATDGWYYNGASQFPNLETWVGDADLVPDKYHARFHVDAIAQNFSGGHLYIFHDQQDSSVPVVNASNVKAALDGLGRSNYSYNISDVGSPDRWTHGYPSSVADLIDAEPLCLPASLNRSAWTIPVSGTVIVAGYLVTKRFSIWLGGLTEAAAGAGLDEYASVVYDTVAGTYEITPLTGNMDVFIKQGSLTASQSITGVETLTVT